MTDAARRDALKYADSVAAILRRAASLAASERQATFDDLFFVLGHMLSYHARAAEGRLPALLALLALGHVGRHLGASKTSSSRTLGLFLGQLTESAALREFRSASNLYIEHLTDLVLEYVYETAQYEELEAIDARSESTLINIGMNDLTKLCDEIAEVCPPIVEMLYDFGARLGKLRGRHRAAAASCLAALLCAVHRYSFECSADDTRSNDEMRRLRDKLSSCIGNSVNIRDVGIPLECDPYGIPGSVEAFNASVLDSYTTSYASDLIVATASESFGLFFRRLAAASKTSERAQLLAMARWFEESRRGLLDSIVSVREMLRRCNGCRRLIERLGHMQERRDARPSAREIALGDGCIRTRGLEVSIGDGGRKMYVDDLLLRPGSVTLLTSPSGSGKTTLLSVLSGRRRPDAGRVFLGDVDAATLSPTEICSVTYRISQYTMQNLGVSDVRSVLRFGSCERSSRSKGSAKLAEALRAVGMTKDFLDREYRTLSGGEKQRLCVARYALSADGRRSFVFFDEALSSVDGATAREVLRSVAAIARRRKHTLVLVEHRPELVRGLCDGVASIRSVEGGLRLSVARS